jgi:hemoglobin
MMLRKAPTWLGIFLLTGCVTGAPQPTVYEQLGGADGVEAIVADFVYLMATDDKLAQMFEFTDFETLQQHLEDQFCELTGGGCTYAGRDMVEAHKGLNMTHREFNLGVEHLQQAMIDNDTPVAAQNRLLAILAPTRPDVVKK